MDTFDNRFTKEFLAVAREGSIRKAAERLNAVPSAISRKISDVEIRLGVKLFERSSQGVILTTPGEVFLEHVVHVTDEQEHVLERLGKFRGDSQRVVRIVAGEGFAADLMQNGLTNLRLHHPDLRYEVAIAGTEAMIRMVLHGDVDIAMAYNPIIAAGVRSLAIGRQPLCAVLPSKSDLTRAKACRFQDVLAGDVALLPPEHGVRQLVALAASDHGLPVVPILETTSITMLIRFVGAGLGATFLPRFSASIQAERGELSVVDLEEPSLRQASAHLLVRARRRLPKAVNIVATQLSTHMIAFN